MSKIFIIPDVHGRDFWKKAYDYVDKVDEVIFLGDYLDPYEFPKNKLLKTLKKFSNLRKNTKMLHYCGVITIIITFLHLIRCGVVEGSTVG